MQIPGIRLLAHQVAGIRLLAPGENGPSGSSQAQQTLQLQQGLL
jgi:hypothetical protein